MFRIPCLHAHCTGHIIRIEAAKADLSWRRSADGSAWSFDAQPRSFCLHCSGNHEPLKVSYRELPKPLQAIAHLDVDIPADDFLEAA